MATKKHMDVAKPGEIKIHAGSKPMVVGHEPASDPTIKDPDTDSASEPLAPSHAKKKLEPLSEEVKQELAPDKSDEASKESTESEEPQVEVKPTEDDTTTELKQSDDTETADANKPTDKADKPKDKSDAVADADDEPSDEDAETAADKEAANEADTALAREERLQELITSKEYFVPIKESKGSSGDTFIKTFLATLIVAIIILLVLLDAEILDLGITPPTDLL